MPPRQHQVAFCLVTDPTIAAQLLRGARTHRWTACRGRVDLMLSFHASALQRRLEQGSLAGMILDGRNTDLVEAAVGSGVPAVFVLRQETPCVRPCVVIDDYACGRLAAEHLLEQGLRHFAFCGPGQVHPERMSGFLERLAEAGFEADRCLARATTNSNTAETALHQELANLPKPVGIMAWSDWWSQRVATVAGEAGWRMPDDLAVIGVDANPDFCDETLPACSSVDPDYERIGKEAAAMLDGLLERRLPSMPVVRVPPRGVVVRGSTVAPPARDDRLNEARAFIRLRLDEELDVNAVARHLAMSRRSLERHFRATFGRGCGQEIRRARLEHAKSLLLETNLALVEIAVACGFGSAPALGRSFKRVYGQPPGAYRRHRARPWVQCSGSAMVQLASRAECESTAPDGSACCG